MAVAIASGEDVELDTQSLGEHGDKPEAVRDYLEPFEAQDPSQKYPFPRLSFPATAVIMHDGKEHHVDRFGTFGPLTKYNFSPRFNPDITLPTLVDPQVRTFADLKDLESVDPGHAEQLFEAYRMAAKEQKDAHPGARFKDPHVIRMVAILPTGYDYKTDFLPDVEMPSRRREPTNWDPRLLVNGALNYSGDYLTNQGHFDRGRVVYSLHGKEAALRASRPLPEQTAQDQANALMPLANHELNRMGVILFPYQFLEAPRREVYSYGDSELKGSSRSFGGGGDVGAATIGAGSVGMLGAVKRHENIFGDRFVPETGGQPVVYSIRILSAMRNPDSVTA